LAEEIRRAQPGARVIEGTLENLPEGEKFDSILYVDVLEHIAGDRREIENAFHRLRDKERWLCLLRRTNGCGRRSMMLSGTSGGTRVLDSQP
jgi:hypothetical protein